MSHAAETLRTQLIQAQYQLRQQGQARVLLVLMGVKSAGRIEVIRCLNQWLDPRFVHTLTVSEPSYARTHFPPFWPYWQQLPPLGEIGLCYSNWYHDCLSQALNSPSTLDASLARITRFEAHLQRHGSHLLKCYLQLDQSQQIARLQALQQDPDQRWRLGEDDQLLSQHYSQLVELSQHIITETHSEQAPWLEVDANDPEHRDLSIGHALLAQLQQAITPPTPAVANPKSQINPPDHLAKIDLTLSLSKKGYNQQLQQQQRRLGHLMQAPGFKQLSVAMVMEGVDAAGKGGALRRLVAELDPRLYRIHPIAAPTREELAYPYLWRFWQRLPWRGHLALFDRSWYGRVLVERVEQLISPAQWSTAYGEINEFEQQLTDSRILVVKCWLWISAEEQLRRFKRRQQTAFKRFKLTEDDWRNREQWDTYYAAINDMLQQTSTPSAPWHSIAAEDKRYARVQVIKTLCDRIEQALD